MGPGNDDSPIVIATKEQNRVAASKCAMVFVLLVVALGLSIATLLLFRKNEEDGFERTVRTIRQECEIFAVYLSLVANYQPQV